MKPLGIKFCPAPATVVEASAVAGSVGANDVLNVKKSAISAIFAFAEISALEHSLINHQQYVDYAL